MELRYLGRLSLCFGLLSTTLCHIDYEKCHLLLKTPEARSHVKHGDHLTYQFSVTLNISADADSMAVLVNGSNLQVLDTSDLLETKFTWRNSDGLIADINAPSFGVEVVQESDFQPVSEIDLQIPLTFGELQLQRVSGEMSLHVTDTAPLGSIIRPFMYILLLMEQKPVYQTTILGDYVFIEIPELEVSAAEPRALEMKETAIIMAYLRIPKMPLKKTLLNVYIPRNESTDCGADDICTNEPYLTVTDFQVVTYTGLSEESSQRIAEISPIFLSGSRTSEFDGIAFDIPQLYDNDTASRNTSYELGFQAEVKSLDFSGSYEGMELKVAYVLETGDNFFVIRNSSLIAKRSFDVERVPKLHFVLELMDTETEKARAVAYYQLNVWHAQNVSWSSAYNVSVLLYLPPFLRSFELQKTKDVVRTNSPVENILHDCLIEFKLARVSFIHNVRLQFRVILKTSHTLYQPGEKFMIFVEALYSNNFRDSEFIRDIAGFPNVFNVTKAKEDAITMPLCECLGDKFAQCRCSIENDCDKKIGSVNCVECSVPWRCVKVLENFGRACSLKCGGNVTYFCGSTKRKRKTREIVTCSKQFTNGSVERLSPVVGTILGCDRRGDRLYGISQNGLAYVISDDEGTTWYNIPAQMHARALKTSTFQGSIFV